MGIGELLGIVLVLIIIGVCLWLAETYIPMAAPFKIVIRVIVVLVLILWLLSRFGIVPVFSQL